MTLIRDKYQANDILKDMTDRQKERLYDARDGYAFDEDDKETNRLLHDGYVQLVNFEYVHAKNSVRGVTTTEAGDKLLQELDNQSIVSREKVTLVDNGNVVDVDTVDVKDPNPADNVDKDKAYPDTVDNTVQDKGSIGTQPNPGDYGTFAEAEKTDDNFDADKEGAGFEATPTPKTKDKGKPKISG